MRALAVGVSILIGVSIAEAQDTRLAAVDASGRVMPLSAASPAMEIIDTSARAAPCAKARPLSLDDARTLVTRIATEENFYPDFVLSIAKIESHFNSMALSDKGAFGLMQLMPSTAQRFKVDLCDPANNVRGGVRYLRVLHAKYRNPLYILAAYNAGEDAVDKNRGVPPYPETVRFVAQVIDDFYTWPVAAARPAGAAGDSSTATSDLVEPFATKPGAEPHPAQTRIQAQWSDGFVMHID